MRIWIVNHYADPPDGLATRSFDIARRLIEKGNPTTIFACSFSHYHLKPARRLGWRLWREEDIEGVRYVWIAGTPYRSNDWRRVLNMLVFTVLAFVAGAVRRERPQVVVGVSVHPLAALSGYFLARIKGARFFFEITDLWPETLIDFGRLRPDGRAARWMRTLERYLFEQSERIIMLWRHTDSYVESQGVSSSKILWLPHGVELARYEQLEPYDGAPDRPFRIMFLGGFVASNSVDTIIDAAAVLEKRGRSDIKFLLIGAGSARDGLISQAKSMGLKNVEFPPPVPKRDVSSVMGDADAFIYGLRDLPLYRFGISLNKLTDYLAAGRPIVFFGKSSYDPVRDANAGVSVPPGDPEVLADGIERLADLPPQERMEMGERGRRYLVEYHNIPRLADRLLDVFQDEHAPSISRNDLAGIRLAGTLLLAVALEVFAVPLVISFAFFVLLALALTRFADAASSAVLAFVLALYVLAGLTMLEVNRITDIAGKPVERRPAALIRIGMLAALPVAILVSSPQRVTLSAVIALGYVAVAVLSFKLSRANRVMLAYVGVAAAWMILSWLRTKYLLHLTPEQLNYGTSKLTYFGFIVLPMSAAVAMMVDRAEDLWPAAASQLAIGLGVGLITIALLGDRILGVDRYTWQGNLIALGTLVAVQPWLVKNFWASAAIGVLGVGGIMYAGARQSLVAFGLALLLSAVYWTWARFARESGDTVAQRLKRAVANRYVALPLVLVVLTGAAIVVTYNTTHYCNCVTDRLIALEGNSGDRDTLLRAGVQLFTDSPILGTGLGSFDGVVKDTGYQGGYYLYPHNIPLEVLSETGLIGFLLIIAPLLITWVVLFWTGVQRASPAIATLAMIVAVFFVVANISGDIPSDRGMWIFGIVALKLGYDAWQSRPQAARRTAPERVDVPLPVS
jgi:glycosyltransferase involved in cell wall biosynthesis/O-antigen ligase